MEDKSRKIFIKRIEGFRENRRGPEWVARDPSLRENFIGQNPIKSM